MSQNSRSSSRLSAKRFEILMGLHNKVVKPNLVAGQTLSGFLIHKVFAAKALYLRPNKMLLQMPHDDTNKITNAYASDLQDESQKPLNNESHCEVHQTGEELHQEIPTLQLTNTDVICSTPFSDLGNYENKAKAEYCIHGMNRFKLGLSTLDVLDAIRKFPQAFQPAFCHTETKLTSQEIDQMFSIVMESQGSNKRQTQSKVTGWWRDYLIDAQEEETGVSLGEILAFATGTDYPPALGWETKPSIEFIYSSDLLPTANTCANILRLPTVHKEYEDFKKNMDFAIQNSPGFGQA
ncbi:UNVERIFIED_CONTAM: hypothetical protein FKN15_006173 [Acipenser sinensis]